MTPYSIRMADSICTQVPSYTQKWAYDYGVLLKGLAALWSVTGCNRYYQYIKNGMDYFIEENGNIRLYRQEDYTLDNINNGKILLWLYEQTGEPRYQKAAGRLRNQLTKQPRTSEGAFWHKKCYPYQIWLDGLYMASPFYAAYVRSFENGTGYDDVIKQFTVCESHLKDKNSGLLYHAWDEKHKQFWCDPITGLSKNFWGRAMGWYVMALVDVLDYIPEDHSDRPKLIGFFRSAIESLLKIRDSTSGVWYQMLDKGNDQSNYLEASVSCMACYAIAKGSRLGYLPPNYKTLAGEIFSDIVDEFLTITPDGMLHLNKVCAVAGLGGKDHRDGSFSYYVGEPVVSNDFKGVGPFLLAGTEIEFMQKGSLIHE